MNFIYKVGDDAYLEWSTVVDAPVSFVMSRAAMLDAGQPTERLERVDQFGHSIINRAPAAPHDLLSFNRAGPNEACLTVEALLERWASTESYEAFELTVDKIAPYTTSCAVPEGAPEYGIIYWVPWKPGEGPAHLDATTDLHTMIRDDASGVFAGGFS